MKRWLKRFRADTAAQAAPPPAPAVPDSSHADADGESFDVGEALLTWLLDAEAPRDAVMDAAERQAIARLDALVDAKHPPGSLLPRTPAVVPRLMSLLRRGDASLSAMSQHIASDIPLTTEVLRQAGSAAYCARGTVADVERALTLLGVDGLRSVIARVVLRPLFYGHTGRLSGTASASLWKYAEEEAQAAATAAAARGLDRFDGYLAGLVHCTGWSIAFRELDRLAHPLAVPFSRTFVQLLLPRKDALFAKAVGSWQLTPAVTALCAAVCRHGIANAASPLARVLMHAERQAAMSVLRDPLPPDA